MENIIRNNVPTFCPDISRHFASEARAESDFDINVKAEMEIETILLYLEQQNDLMLKILHHLENESRQPPKD
jgi:hypothetical protein